MNTINCTQTLALLLSGLGACTLLSGCVVLGYSSRGGFFVWPGSIGLILLGLLLWFLFRPR